MIKRRKTRLVRVGDVPVGGTAPVSIQSMTKTDTRAVSKTVAQIKALERAGCDIIRVAVPDMDAAKAIRQIKRHINIPLVADIHFHYHLAIEAINSGADKIRLNPGNIKEKKDIASVIKLARKKMVPIRIGVNSGSIQGVKALRRQVTSKSLIAPVLGYIKLFESFDFRDIIISLKASDVTTTIEAYRQMAGECDYPFHLGVTAAGSPECGLVKSSVGIGTLLAEGIGDTIRVSLTADPAKEVAAAKEILRALGLKKPGIEIISCPTCGRCEVDLVKIVREFENQINRRGVQPYAPTKVAIMGCVVNGPGEATEADLGIAAGKGCGMLFKNGKMIRKVKESDFVKALLHEMDK